VEEVTKTLSAVVLFEIMMQLAEWTYSGNEFQACGVVKA